jgi:hypothetical protein
MGEEAALKLQQIPIPGNSGKNQMESLSVNNTQKVIQTREIRVLEKLDGWGFEVPPRKFLAGRCAA